MTRKTIGFDTFTLSLVAVLTAASLLPARGTAAWVLDHATVFAIALLFFLHGAKLSREAILAGVTHWRLHLTVFASTFVLFPLMGFALRPLLSPLVTPELYVGVLFLCVLPATVQSAIAFTSMARGNVAAAVCSASASSLIGVFLTPALASLLIGYERVGNGDTPHAVGKIVLQLLVPFLAGHVARRWIGGWVEQHRGTLRFVDQGAILLVVYVAFSEAVLLGLWHRVPLSVLAGVLLISAILLALALLSTRTAARALGFDKADEITTIFCGSKKSLATGVPMAKVLFAAPTVGVILLPLMVFHQMQLMVCLVLAQRYAARASTRE